MLCCSPIWLNLVCSGRTAQRSAPQPVPTWPGEWTAGLAHGIRILGQDCLKITEILPISMLLSIYYYILLRESSIVTGHTLPKPTPTYTIIKLDKNGKGTNYFLLPKLRETLSPQRTRSFSECLSYKFCSKCEYPTLPVFLVSSSDMTKFNLLWT